MLALIPPKDIETAFEYALDFTDEFDKDEIDSTKLEAFTDYVFTMIHVLIIMLKVSFKIIEDVP